jgi:hypothetical protein
VAPCRSVQHDDTKAVAAITVAANYFMFTNYMLGQTSRMHLGFSASMSVSVAIAGWLFFCAVAAVAFVRSSPRKLRSKAFSTGITFTFWCSLVFGVAFAVVFREIPALVALLVGAALPWLVLQVAVLTVPSLSAPLARNQSRPLLICGVSVLASAL